VGALLATTAFSLALAACGSSSPSGPTAATGSTTPSSATHNSTPAPTPHSTSVPGASALPTKAKLGSLTNYTFNFTDNGSLAMHGEVYSQTDYQTTQPNVQLHTATATYSKLGTTWYETVQPANVQHYSTSPYPEAVKGFLGYLKVAGATVTKGASCSEAGQAGTTFTIESKELNSKVLNELANACISNSSGALLSYALGAQGSGVGTSNHHVTYSFTIDSIGGVAKIPVPTNVKKDTTTSPTG
jgi:hypothetical protein